jgi:hypothetical protein
MLGRMILLLRRDEHVSEESCRFFFGVICKKNIRKGRILFSTLILYLGSDS